ncbi:hypothetical protein Tco_0164430 [Tanacetum coccineum]
MDPVAEYQSEFEILINRITGISEYLLKMFYISGLKPALQIELLREMSTTLGEAISLARITKALASPEVKGSLDVDEDIGVDEVSSAIDGVFIIGESNVESMEVPSKFGEFSENKESVEEVVVGGGETLGVDEYESNKVILVLKDGCGEFDDSLDEINLGLSEEFVIRALEGRDVFSEKSREVFSVTPWATEGGRRVLCYVQGNVRRKNIKMEAAIQRRLWDPGIKSVFQNNTLRTRANTRLKWCLIPIQPLTGSYQLVLSLRALVERASDLDGNDPDAEYALFRLLQRGTVAEYQNKFEILISRVTGKFECLLASIYIFGLKPTLIRALLWSNPTTLGEAFALARVAEAHVQDLEEITRHKPNKVEVVKTSMVATSEEHEQHEYLDELNEISKEKDDAKPQISADTFGSNGGNDSKTSGPRHPRRK